MLSLGSVVLFKIYLFEIAMNEELIFTTT